MEGSEDLMESLFQNLEISSPHIYYSGEFESGEKSGDMEMYDSVAGILTQGTFRSGKLNGEATRIWERGEVDWVQSCEFKNGVIEGESQVETSTGKQYNLEFIGGNLISIAPENKRESVEAETSPEVPQLNGFSPE